MRDIESNKMELLDFSSEKKAEWEKKRYPYAAHLEITPKCNFNCVHCYLQQHHHEHQLSYDEIISIIDVLYEKGIIFLTLTGGEIFTRKDFMDIYMYVKKKGFLVELFTNGALITDEIIKTLAKYPPLLVEISLYGGCEETYKKVTGIEGAFDRVVSSCKKLIDANIRLSLKSPIINLTYGEIEDMRKIADDLGVTFAPTFEICSTIDGDDLASKYMLTMKQILQYEINDFYKRDITNVDMEREKEQKLKAFERREYMFNCKIGLTSFVIDYEGNMIPCMKVRHRGRKLTKDNFDEVWEEFGTYQNMKFSPKCKCIDCPSLYYCETCSAETEFNYGDLEYRPAETCMYARARQNFYEKNMTGEEIINSLPDC